MTFITLETMEDFTFITMLLKCMAEQDEQITAQEKAIAELNQEMSDLLSPYKDDIEKLQAQEPGD